VRSEGADGAGGVNQLPQLVDLEPGRTSFGRTSKSRGAVNRYLGSRPASPGAKETPMAHPVVHAEIRSQDPDATRRFFADLFGWKVASEGAFPGYTFIDTGVEGGTFVAISPRQSAEDEVLFFVAVGDVEATLARAEELGGSIVQPAQHVPGTSFGVFADALGHKVGVASNG
jgi:predicted enzyme related to lactoylglutathione lyase